MGFSVASHSHVFQDDADNEVAQHASPHANSPGSGVGESLGVEHVHRVSIPFPERSRIESQERAND